MREPRRLPMRCSPHMPPGLRFRPSRSAGRTSMSRPATQYSARSNAAAASMAGSRWAARSASPIVRSGPRYGVYQPMWAHMWSRTVQRAQGGRASLSLAGLVRPRIEPEVVFGLRAPLAGGRRCAASARGGRVGGARASRSCSRISRTGSSRPPIAPRPSGCTARLVVGTRGRAGRRSAQSSRIGIAGLRVDAAPRR